MPDPVTGIAAGSSIIGGIGASKAASAQKQGAKDQYALQKQMFDKQMSLMEPYARAGQGQYGLEGLQGLLGQQGQADFYSQYYDSPQFQAMANQSQNQQMAAAEQAGGLQSTSTQNQLARIAPQMGMQALQNQMNQYGSMATMGQNAATGQATAAGNFGKVGAESIGNIAAARAGQAQIPFQVGTQILEGGTSMMGFGGAGGQDWMGGLY